MNKIYKLTPSLHNNIWGGNKLREYGKLSDADRIGESWELSFVNGAEALTEDGLTTTEAFGRSAWGKNCQRFPFFPVLTKFIDAREILAEPNGSLPYNAASDGIHLNKSYCEKWGDWLLEQICK